MLGIDHPRAGNEAAEPGADPGVFGIERRAAIPGPRAGGSLRLGDAHAAGARLWAAWPEGERTVAALCAEDDRTEPGANHALDRALPASRRGAGSPLPAAPVCEQIHGRRHRAAGRSRRAAGNPQRATRRILQREWGEFGYQEYERLAEISVAHIYRLRRRAKYRQRRLRYTQTRPAAVSIGERRRPNPQGQPGYLRLDTVHPGDRDDGVKGVYHINAVDEVTQWQVVGAAFCISQAGLEPVLQAMLEQFPFRLRGFHSDHGSEFINEMVETLWNQLLIEQTKSRPDVSRLIRISSLTIGVGSSGRSRRRTV
jgi:hypothetical protein